MDDVAEEQERETKCLAWLEALKTTTIHSSAKYGTTISVKYAEENDKEGP